MNAFEKVKLAGAYRYGYGKANKKILLAERAQQAEELTDYQFFSKEFEKKEPSSQERLAIKNTLKWGEVYERYLKLPAIKLNQAYSAMKEEQEKTAKLIQKVDEALLYTKEDYTFCISRLARTSNPEKATKIWNAIREIPEWQEAYKRSKEELNAASSERVEEKPLSLFVRIQHSLEGMVERFTQGLSTAAHALIQGLRYLNPLSWFKSAKVAPAQASGAEVARPNTSPDSVATAISAESSVSLESNTAGVSTQANSTSPMEEHPAAEVGKLIQEKQGAKTEVQGASQSPAHPPMTRSGLKHGGREGTMASVFYALTALEAKKQQRAIYPITEESGSGNELTDGASA